MRNNFKSIPPTRPRVAQSVVENSAWSGAIPGGRRCARESAPIASGLAGNVIATGYTGPSRPEHHATNSRSLESPSSEVAQ